MTKVMAIGELLIDFTQLEEGHYKQYAGGAPANVLAVLAKFGIETAFIGKVGQDHFGEFLRQSLHRAKIDTSQLYTTTQAPTTVAFVHLDEEGDRSFTFYRNPGADQLLTVDDIHVEKTRDAGVFHFGSISLTNQSCAEATFYALELAKEAGALISFDPNIREDLWADLAHAKQMIERALPYADLVKVSEEELFFLTGATRIEAGMAEMKVKYGIRRLFVTVGAEGCYYKWDEHSGHLPSFPIQALDTTGAGDAFIGSILYGLIQEGGSLDLELVQLEQIIRFANAVAAITTTRNGAIQSFPTLEEVTHFLKEK